MPKVSSKDLKATPFSISSQFTGPPFSVSLESSAIRNLLMRELGIPGVPKVEEAAPVATIAKKERKHPAAKSAKKSAAKGKPKRK